MASSSRPHSILSILLDSRAISNLFKYLTDTDLSQLAVNKELTERTLSDSRWTEKIRRALFNGFYLNYLINQLGDGQSIVEEKNDDARENNIVQQVDTFLQDMKEHGIRHFQTIYARYCKARYLDKHETLDADKLILFSHHSELIENWLVKNRHKIVRNEPLGLEGKSAIFYLALSGYRDGLQLYHQSGFDFTVSDIQGDSILRCIGLSGNKAVLQYCTHELKIDMTQTTVHKEIGIQHDIARSGSVSALLYAKNQLNLNMKALTKDNVSVPHMAAASGNPHSMWICRDQFKLPMNGLTAWKSGVPHFAGESGSKEAILACHEMKLDMHLQYSGKGVQHSAAISGKREALEICQALGLDMTLYSGQGLSVQHYAALGGIETLRFCRDIGLDMQAESKNDIKAGIQHLTAIKSSWENLAFCSELGLNLDKLDAHEQGIGRYAAAGRNSALLRFFKKSGRTFQTIEHPQFGSFGTQHDSAHGGDPLTILHCVEYGMDMKAEDGVRLGAERFAAQSDNPAALLIAQLLDLPMDLAVRTLANDSKNPAMRILAQLMAHHQIHRVYPIEIELEWNKIVFENTTEHLAAFFLIMSKRINDGFFTNGFWLSQNERLILRELPYQLQTMKEENLARVYIYLNYLHLNCVMTKKISYDPSVVNTFTDIMRYAIDRLLHKIQELKKQAALDNTRDGQTLRL